MRFSWLKTCSADDRIFSRQDVSPQKKWNFEARPRIQITKTNFKQEKLMQSVSTTAKLSPEGYKAMLGLEHYLQP